MQNAEEDKVMKTAADVYHRTAEIRHAIDSTPKVHMGELKSGIYKHLVAVSGVLYDYLDECGQVGVAAPEPGSLAAKLMARNATLRKERDDARRSLEFHKDWVATRWERLRDLLHDTPYWHDYAAIVANGTADVHEAPVYAQRLNMMRHRAELAEEKLAKARELSSDVTQVAAELGRLFAEEKAVDATE